MQSIDWIETYAYGINKNLLCKKEEIKCNSIIKTFDYITKEDIKKKNNSNWPEIHDYPYRI